MQRKRSSEEVKLKELFRELIAASGINTAVDAQNLIKEMLSGTPDRDAGSRA